jgi:hypothetical protein
MEYPHRQGGKATTSWREASGESGRAILAFLQGAQASLSASLMQHMGKKLLKGEHVSHQAFERQGFDELLFIEHLHTAGFAIQVQDDVMADQLRGDIIAFKINADHAMPIHFALQMQAIELAEPAVWIHSAGQGG